MPTIRVDPEVYAYLESKALPYVEVEANQTLRRLFGLPETAGTKRRAARPAAGPPPRRKQPKASLLGLQRAGLLQDGQTLYLHDYRGELVPGVEATVAGQRVVRNGNTHSMSQLAAQLLQEHGYGSESVRGPALWFTSDGTSIKELWAKYRANGRSGNHASAAGSSAVGSS
ncbi:MAG TPA: hypothetical protein VEW03_00380 [Longimicrobiaceae bacterium]|nr:hypothetical protein [Longimicrobiaceae bacterium]